MMKYVFNGKVNAEIADALYEISNVGVGMASIALGKMTDSSISIGIPKVVAVTSDYEDMIRDDPEKIAIGILMSMEKSLSGAVLFVIDSPFLSELVQKLTGHSLQGEALVENKESLSAISEVANIMAAAYMKAIGAYTGLRIYLSPVMFGVDVISALISYSLDRGGIRNQNSICVDTSFSVMGEKESKTAGRVIMFPKDHSVQKIIEALDGRG